jgi:type IV pilus assembly protein PilA
MIRNIRNKIRKNRGFTLVELMIVVAIVGILAALAIYGVSKYVANSKTAEARTSVGKIAKDAAAAYQREKLKPGLVAEGGTAEKAISLCKSASKPVPEDFAKVKGMKYQSAPTDWTVDGDDTGFKCLRFSVDSPQYYQYNYTVAPDEKTFKAEGKGDLDGDDLPSLFLMEGEVRGDTVTLSPSVEETDGGE